MNSHSLQHMGYIQQLQSEAGKFQPGKRRTQCLEEGGSILVCSGYTQEPTQVSAEEPKAKRYSRRSCQASFCFVFCKEDSTENLWFADKTEKNVRDGRQWQEYLSRGFELKIAWREVFWHYGDFWTWKLKHFDVNGDKDS